MNFTIYEFAGKESYLQQRLLDAGHAQTRAEGGKLTTSFDVMILDCDWPWAYPRPILIQGAKQNSAKVVLYPHGGRPTVWLYDGIAPANPDVDLRLEHGPGSIEMASTFIPHGSTDVELRQKAPGWLYSPTQDFQPVEKPRKILFAPLHANIEAIQRGLNGHDPAAAMNNAIFKRLLELPNTELTVSCAGPLWKTGVWPHPRAKIVPNPMMRFEASLALIEAAEVVVGAGTMAAAAVARGKPTVMFDQDLFMDYVNGEYVHAAHADDYRASVRYPLDVADGPLVDLIKAACAEEQSEWRQKWVGTDGTAEAIRLIEDLCRPTVEAKSDVVIQGATARATTRS